MQCLVHKLDYTYMIGTNGPLIIVDFSTRVPGVNTFKIRLMVIFFKIKRNSFSSRT
jgi:hypothetical protein